MDEPESKSRVAAQVLLAQYQVVAHHHTHFMGLIWQVPAIAIAVVGALAGVSFGGDVPLPARASVLLLGAVFLFVMTISLERYRMFQLRRRKDMQDIEAELVPMGGRRLAWGGREIASEIRHNQFSAPGVVLYRYEGYGLLRIFMYLMQLILLALCIFTIGQILTGTP